MIAFIVLCLVLLARAYPGSGADLVDWRPTRSHEVEAQLELDDVAQMIEAQNAYRRRRGAAEITEADAEQMAREDEAIRERARRRHDERLDGSRTSSASSEGRAGMARALIVGCGCRGRALGRALLDRGWQVRGTSRDPATAAEIEAAGIEGVQADPDRIGTIVEQLEGVSLIFWLLGSASGEA